MFQPITTDQIIEQLDQSSTLISRRVFDLVNLDLEEGMEIAILLCRMKRYLEMGGQLEIHQAPQVLAHNLYRIGLLEHPNLTMIQTRMDQAHAG